ncbi:MAG: 1-(5-phosphoribosyl)-5-amino-4-imidazole-carboxylate carboxylase, partial [Clostridiaceae bacterium]|nr:1-(5-phosphoribosyl)-5-amino-4-imidazole-carboxylate carboxylase [Clostridiaceae bacterium]
MNQQETLNMLNAIKSGTIAPEDALEHLKTAPFDDLGYAMIDNHRNLRQGVPEVIYGRSKTT